MIGAEDRFFFKFSNASMHFSSKINGISDIRRLLKGLAIDFEKNYRVGIEFHN